MAHSRPVCPPPLRLDSSARGRPRRRKIARRAPALFEEAADAPDGIQSVLPGRPGLGSGLKPAERLEQLLGDFPQEPGRPRRLRPFEAVGAALAGPRGDPPGPWPRPAHRAKTPPLL